MTFRLPNFNTTVNIWHGTVPIPPITSPSLSPVCNLCVGRRILLKAGLAPSYPAYMQLLAPSGTDIRSTIYGGSADTIEAPAGSGRYYTVEWVDNVATGFANQHVLAILKQTGTWTPPSPPPMGGWTDTMVDSNGTIIPPHTSSNTPGGYTMAPQQGGGGTLGQLWIQSNTAQAQSVAVSNLFLNNAAMVYFDPLLATYTFTSPILLGTAFGASVQVWPRYDPLGGNSNGYIVDVNPGNCSIIPVVGGIVGSPIASNTLTLSLSTVYTLTVQNTGTTIVATINSVVTTGITSTFAGNTKIAIAVANSGMGLDNTQFGQITVA